MDPLAGLQRLLLNPKFRECMQFTKSDLTPEQIRAGHFLTSTIAQEALALMPKLDVPVHPLYIGWWADATNVSCGGMSRSFNSE